MAWGKWKRVESWNFLFATIEIKARRRPGNSSVMYDVTCVVGASNAVDGPIDIGLPKLFRLSLVEGVVEVPAVPHIDSSHRTRLKE